jgi:predicted GNAT family acetyltransferase
VVRQVDDPHRLIDLARWVPDLPAWVDVRGALLCGRSMVFTAERPGAFAIVTPHLPLVCLVGRPAADVVHGAVAYTERRAGETPVLVVDAATIREVEALLPDWRRETAILHTVPPAAGARRPAHVRIASAVDVRWVEAGAVGTEEMLAHVTEELRDELVDAAQHTMIACAWADGRPVAFAYSPWTTERFFDISVDTLEEHRRRGFGAACVRALVARLRATGREPVWGALASNDASLALAARLGFEPVAEIAIFQREEDQVVEL